MAKLCFVRAAMLTLIAAVASAWVANFKHEGALVGSSLETSPIAFGGKLYLMRNEMGRFAPDNGPHSYWCINDMATGEYISCPASSSGFAFASAISSNASGVEVAWVFASAWDRANSNQPDCKPWGCGACAQGHCYIAAWSSTDLISWAGPYTAVTLPVNVTVPNVAVGVVQRATPAPAGLPTHYGFMALEGGRIALNTNPNFNFSGGWVLLNLSAHAVEGPGVGQARSCPSARYNDEDGFYYVMGGGQDVDITRSANLSINSWQAPSTGHVEQGCTDDLESCGPGSAVAGIADGWYVNYWSNGSDRGDRAFLSNLTSWQYSVNDVDVCDLNGVTYFIYGMCCQTAPANELHGQVRELLLSGHVQRQHCAVDGQLLQLMV